MAATQFKDYLSRNHLKLTRERRVILEQILSVRGHFDVDDLLVHLRQAGHRVSRATLYRTLPRLVESGLVHKLEMASGQARYETMFGRHHHDHLVCLGCGSIIEFESPEVERIQEAVCRRKRFRMTGHTHQIRGYCADCEPDAGAGGRRASGARTRRGGRAAGGARRGGRAAH
ncbi:MAG TPA: transcriptional repressor [Candidatus Polarisedimenticolia bacterium]|nr:transcriptional repressor [Candidatus Polarisedimenticolia bacterium]